MKPTSTAALLGLLIAISACTSTRAAGDPTSPTDQQAATGHDSHQHGTMAGGPGMHKAGMHQQMAGKHDHMAEHCPMRVEGTTVTAVDTETGVALAFTTSGDVAELRRRVAAMAEHKKKMMSKGHGQMGKMHSEKGMQEHGQGATGEHQHGDKAQNDEGSGCSCCSHGAGMHGPRIEHTVQVVEIAGGAQLVLTPKQSSDLAALREQVREKSKMMQEGKCPMMKGHGSGPAHEHTASPSEHH